MTDAVTLWAAECTARELGGRAAWSVVCVQFSHHDQLMTISTCLLCAGAMSCVRLLPHMLFLLTAFSLEPVSRWTDIITRLSLVVGRIAGYYGLNNYALMRHVFWSF